MEPGNNARKLGFPSLPSGDDASAWHRPHGMRQAEEAEPPEPDTLVEAHEADYEAAYQAELAEDEFWRTARPIEWPYAIPPEQVARLLYSVLVGRRPALSNSGFYGQTGKTEAGNSPPTLSIDRVSLTLGAPWMRSTSQYSEMFRRAFNRTLGEEYTAILSPTLRYKYHCTFKDALDVQFGRRQGKHDGVRLEWNPNSPAWAAAGGYSVLLPVFNSFSSLKFRYAKLTRLDWALDYFTPMDLGRLYRWGTNNSCQYQTELGIETLYLGSFKSDVMIRAYNKVIEQREVHKVEPPHNPWWRIEIQDRRGGYWQTATPDNLLGDVHYASGFPSAGMWQAVAARAVLQGMQHLKQQLYGVDRRLWERHLEPHITPDPDIHPSEDFKRLQGPCWAEFRGALGGVMDESLWRRGKL
jgi:hypothetical protein